MPRYVSKYSEEKSSEIRYNIMGALDELAISSGIDISTMQRTSPYSFVLASIPSQKIAAELKKMIDMGLVVKSIAKGHTVKYMLRGQYDDLFKNGAITIEKFGYGDYRDNKEEEEEERLICARIAASSYRDKYEPMW